MILKTCPSCGAPIPYTSHRCAKCTVDPHAQRRHDLYDKHRDPQEVQFRNSKQWRMMRDHILARDEYQCQECKKHGRITIASEVHHIKPVWQAWDMRLDEDNLVSLCHSCHERVEPKREAPRVG